jgi:DNA-binding response OmpR family regulator
MQRSVPLIVIASASAEFANEVAARLRRQGNVVYVTHSPEGCLRVATSVAPDMVLIDPAFPQRLERLLRAHPGSAQTQILHLTRDSGVRPAIRVAHAA